jgi:LysM repeat protein
MNMDKNKNTSTQLCATCGSKLKEDAKRCLVCGSPIKIEEKKSKSKPSGLSGAKMPEVTMSIPLILLLFLVFIAIGAGLVYITLRATDSIAEATAVPTSTATPTQTMTPTPMTPTVTHTPEPTLEPIVYYVKEGEFCGDIAYYFNVSVEAIRLENNLDVNCTIYPNMELRVPHPTPTQIPDATSTPNATELAYTSCEKEVHIVQSDDTLSSIALYKGVPAEAITRWNGLTSDIVYEGMVLIIPLCEKEYVIGVGTTTPTPAPDYLAPELLLPTDGSFFDGSHDEITLQWASVGELRDNEYYQITVIDKTSGSDLILVSVEKSNSFKLPVDYRPSDNSTHIFEWFVLTVAQIGSNEDGSPVYIPGSPVSFARNFGWASPPEATPEP